MAQNSAGQTREGKIRISVSTESFSGRRQIRADHPERLVPYNPEIMRGENKKAPGSAI